MMHFYNKFFCQIKVVNFLLSVFTLVCCLYTPAGYGQTDTTEENEFYSDSVKLGETGQIFRVIETMPEFPGGVQEFFKYINENIKYPTREKKKGIKGKVYISFTICNDGHVSDVKPYKEVARKEALIKEAMRVISMMPKWKPGTQNGKNVDVIYKVPIIFSIN